VTEDEKRAYSKGYNAGVRHRWPAHKPPRPPEEIIAELIHTAQALRDAIDAQLAMFDDDDPLELAIGHKIEAFDNAMTKVTQWLMNP